MGYPIEAYWMILLVIMICVPAISMDKRGAQELLQQEISKRIRAGTITFDQQFLSLLHNSCLEQTNDHSLGILGDKPERETNFANDPSMPDESYSKSGQSEGQQTDQEVELDLDQNNPTLALQIYTCPQEGCMFSTAIKNGLSVHIGRMHNDEKLFRCLQEGCTYFTTQKNNLTSHIKHKHSNEKPFICTHDSCIYATKTRWELDLHTKRKHSSYNEKPFICKQDSCTYSAQTRLELVQHMKQKHSDERLFACTQKNCTYAAKTKGGLIQHMRHAHSDYRPFVCVQEGCMHAAKSKGDLAKHMKQKHDIVNTDALLSIPTPAIEFLNNPTPVSIAIDELDENIEE